MDQPAAMISQDDIERIILRDYSKFDKEKVLKSLSQYKGYNNQGQYRVWASILKISKGNIDELNKNVEWAIIDFRDIIAMAEYPTYTKKVSFSDEKYNKTELKKIIETDRNQYQEWLNSKK